MEEEVPLGNPFIGEPRGGRPAPKGGGRTASPCSQSPSIISQVVVVEVKERLVEEKKGKEGGDGYPATHFGRSAKLWPQFSSTFHHPPHLDPLMLKTLTKSIKSKANSFHLFLEFFSFLFEIFRFYHMQ
jgi:hypothetical protein